MGRNTPRLSPFDAVPVKAGRLICSEAGTLSTHKPFLCTALLPESNTPHANGDRARHRGNSRAGESQMGRLVDPQEQQE